MERKEVVITKVRQVHIETDGKGEIVVWIVPESQSSPTKNIRVETVVRYALKEPTCK